MRILAHTYCVNHSTQFGEKSCVPPNIYNSRIQSKTKGQSPIPIHTLSPPTVPNPRSPAPSNPLLNLLPNDIIPLPNQHRHHPRRPRQQSPSSNLHHHPPPSLFLPPALLPREQIPIDGDYIFLSGRVAVENDGPEKGCCAGDVEIPLEEDVDAGTDGRGTVGESGKWGEVGAAEGGGEDGGQG